MSALVCMSVEATHVYEVMSSPMWPDEWPRRRTRVLQREKEYERCDASLKTVLAVLISSSF